MNKEMKKILSVFLLKSVVLTCLLCICAGAITAKQRSDFNSYFTPYAVLSVKNVGQGINVQLDDENYSFDFSKLKDLGRYKKYLYFTPFSCTFFIFDSLYDFFSSFKD
jgi:hypothetical protein